MLIVSSINLNTAPELSQYKVLRTPEVVTLCRLGLAIMRYQGIAVSGGHDGNKNSCQDDKHDQSNLLVSGSLSHQRCTRLTGHERLILTSSQV